MVDTHAHLNYAPLAEDVAGVVQRAKEAGVDRIIIPGTGRESSESAVALAQQFSGVWAAVGIHPSDAHLTMPTDLERLHALLMNPKVVALGEVGLDYYHFEGLSDSEIEARKALQQLYLHELIAMAKQYDKPLIIHSRDCFDELYPILCDAAAGHPTVVHCFSGSAEEAAQWLELGFHLSVTGILTYKNAESLRDCVREIPWERLMIETDAPFLAPQPYRGKSCEPFMVTEVARVLAEVKGVDVSMVDKMTTATAERFFRLS
jgi:TatD DNase family protein